MYTHIYIYRYIHIHIFGTWARSVLHVQEMQQIPAGEAIAKELCLAIFRKAEDRSLKR